MDFINKSKEIHGNKYNYSKVNYINNRTKVEIICPIHGSFYTRPYNHLSGRGCPSCKFYKLNNINRLSIDEFINKSKEMHSDKYDYSKVNYINTRTKVIIICPTHGEFKQMPLNHFRYGCGICATKVTSTKNTKITADFINSAKIIHGLKYDYNKVVYEGSHKKIDIICPKHGSFKQTPHSHLQNRGCPECKKGKNHPRYGKPSQAGSYYGEYKGNIFRSLAELFWMINSEKQGINFVGLDQNDRRQFWQVEVNYANKPATYCADFYVYESNEVIEIKPGFKQKIMAEKLKQGASEYNKRGYKFKIIDTKTIKIRPSEFKMMVENQIIKLIGFASKKRFENRFYK